MSTEMTVHRPYGLPKGVLDANYLSAVGLWLHGGSETQICQMLQIPLAQLPKMTITPQWIMMCGQSRGTICNDEAAALTRLIHKSLQLASVRLDSGDPHVLKDGTIVYKPVTAKDAAAIAALFVDRRREVYKEIDGVKDGFDAEHLGDLLSLASKLNQRYDIKRKDAIDGEAVDVTPTEVQKAHPQLNNIDAEEVRA